MSLSKKQRGVIAEKLQAYFEESTLPVQMIAGRLNVTTENVEKALAMRAPLGILSHQLQRFIHLVQDVRDVTSDNIKENG